MNRVVVHVHGYVLTIGYIFLSAAQAALRAYQPRPAKLGYEEAVRPVLANTRIEPRFLELELTETFLMQDSKSTAEVLHAIKAMGVSLALDDFGTGYSSLSYLKRFPIDSLKIDQSFVRDLTTDADDASIVCTVISMGRSLNMRVVAEGVETPEQTGFPSRADLSGGPRLLF